MIHMNEMKITFTDESGLVEAIKALTDAIKTSGTPFGTPSFEPPKQEPAAVAEVPFDVDEPAPVPVTPAPAEKTYTVDELATAGAALIDQGKMPQLLNLLEEFGVQAVTQLNSSVYPAFAAKMKALGADL